MDRLIISARMAEYRGGAVQRRRDTERARSERWDRAQRVAGAAAGIRRPEFCAKRVFLFRAGKALDCFHADFDLDPAVSADVVAIEDMFPALRVDIQTEGREL